MKLAIPSEVGTFFCQLILICHLQLYFWYKEEGIDQTCDLGGHLICQRRRVAQHLYSEMLPQKKKTNLSQHKDKSSIDLASILRRLRIYSK